jgi:hypothetical protein
MTDRFMSESGDERVSPSPFRRDPPTRAPASARQWPGEYHAPSSAAEAKAGMAVENLDSAGKEAHAWHARLMDAHAQPDQFPEALQQLDIAIIRSDSEHLCGASLVMGSENHEDADMAK